jgi:hypothetical protein
VSIEESKQLIRRFYAEVVGAGDYSNLDSFVAADYVDNNAAEESGPWPRCGAHASRCYQNDAEVSQAMCVHANDLTKIHGAHQSQKTSCPTRRCRVKGFERRTVIEEYTLPNGASGPYGNATGPDGALWFTRRGSQGLLLLP